MPLPEIKDEKQVITKSLALIQALKWYVYFYHIEFDYLHATLIIDDSFMKASSNLKEPFLHLILPN